MTRVGDVSLLLGILLVLLHLGNLNILEIDSPEVATHLSPNLLTLSALLIFGGIIGKSAQFPLLTWLPDAMEGPTPVSALLHSRPWWPPASICSKGFSRFSFCLRSP